MVNYLKRSTKSSNTRRVTRWESKLIRMSFCTFKSAISVLWHLQYADWNGMPCDVKCACVWSKTARSVNFETYCKLDTGLKLVNSESTPDFLSRGETNALFQQSGNSPDVREQLIMRVMTGSRTSRQETTSDVGAGSSGQDFFADCRTSFRTSSSLRGWKPSNAFSGPTSGSFGKTMFARELTALLISEWMDSILQIKIFRCHSQEQIYPHSQEKTALPS